MTKRVHKIKPKAELGAEKTLKTFEDIKTLAMQEPTIHHALTHFYDGGFTREQSLIAMVFALHEQKTTYFNEAVRLANNSTQPLRINKD